MSHPSRLAPTRRQFLAGAAAASAVAAPTIVSPRVFGQPGRPAPSDQVVVGSIGVGDLGRRHHLQGHLLTNPRIRVAAVCDVDRAHREEAAQMALSKYGEQIGCYRDFRELCDRSDIDAVLIATPDHWHALTAINAMESGKDVYCEKPLSLTIEEGRAMVSAARRYGRVFQTGSQQRSDRRFRHACELVRNGKIGKVQKVETFIGGMDGGSWQPFTTPPAELDWNFWLGPAPWAEYSANRCHYQFRWFSDYSGGKLTDWGAHHNDIAQWGLGRDGSGPVKVSATGVFSETGPHDIALDFHVTYTYEDGVELHCHAEGENGVKFTGEGGWVFVSRGRIDASDKALLTHKFGASDIRLYDSRDHHNNWLDCIQSRERTICDVEIGHGSCTVCHLGNIALRLGRPLEWDPVQERFVGDEQANLLVSKPMRAPWHL